MAQNSPTGGGFESAYRNMLQSIGRSGATRVTPAQLQMQASKPTTTAPERRQPVGAATKLPRGSRPVSLAFTGRMAMYTLFEADSPALHGTPSAGFCSFVVTHSRHAPQRWRQCKTCGLVGDQGCCLACAETCHAGHELTEERFSNFFCDCGSRGSHQCRALPTTDLEATAKSLIPLLKKDGGLLHSDDTLALSGLSYALQLAHNKQLFRPRPPSQLYFQVRARAMHVLAGRAAQRVYHLKNRLDTHLAANDGAMLNHEAAETVPTFVHGAFAFLLAEIGDNPRTDDPLLKMLARYVDDLKPLSIALGGEGAESECFEKVLKLFKTVKIDDDDEENTEIGRVRVLLRLWLAVGSSSHLLDAAAHLCQLSTTPLPDDLCDLITALGAGHRSERFLRRRIVQTVTELLPVAESVCVNLCVVWPAVSSIETKLSSKVDTTLQRDPSRVSLRPSLCVDVTRGYVFVLTEQEGLSKLGNGRHGTVLGRLYDQRVEFCVHAGGSLVSLNGQLWLRSPILPSDELIEIDPETLRLVPSHRALLVDKASEFDSLERLLKKQDDNKHCTWRLEYLSGSAGAWRPLSSLVNDDTVDARLKAEFLTNHWTFGTEIALPGAWTLLLTKDGFFVQSVLPKTARLGISVGRERRLSVRIYWRASRHFTSILSNEQTGHLMELVPVTDSVLDVSLREYRPTHYSHQAKSIRYSLFEQVQIQHTLISEANVSKRAAYPRIVQNKKKKIEEGGKHDVIQKQEEPNHMMAFARSHQTGLNLKLMVQQSCVGCGCVLVGSEDNNMYICSEPYCHGMRQCQSCYLSHNFAETGPARGGHLLTHRMERVASTSWHNNTPDMIIENEEEAARITAPSAALRGAWYYDTIRKLVVLFPSAGLPKRRRFFRPLKAGDVLDVKDVYGKWYEADVLKIDTRCQRVLVHYHGWNARWDDWIPVTSPRLCPRYQHTKAGRADKTASSSKKDKDNTLTREEAAALEQYATYNRGLDGHVLGSLYDQNMEHVADTIVGSDGEAFAFDVVTGGVWTFNTHGVLEHWSGLGSSSSSSSLLPLQEEKKEPTDTTCLSATLTLLRKMPVLATAMTETWSQVNRVLDIVKTLLNDSSEQTFEVVRVCLSLLKRHFHALVQSAKAQEHHELSSRMMTLPVKPRVEMRSLLMNSILQWPMLRRANIESLFTSAKFRDYDKKADGQSQSARDQLGPAVVDCIAAGFEFLFPAWSERITMMLWLHKHQHHDHWCAVLLEALGMRYHDAYMGYDDASSLLFASPYTSIKKSFVHSLNTNDVQDMIDILTQSLPLELAVLPLGLTKSKKKKVQRRQPFTYMLVLLMSQLYAESLHSIAKSTQPTVSAEESRESTQLRHHIVAQARVLLFKLAGHIFSAGTRLLEQVLSMDLPTGMTISSVLESSDLFIVLEPTLIWFDYSFCRALGGLKGAGDIVTLLTSTTDLLTTVARAVNVIEDNNEIAAAAADAEEEEGIEEDTSSIKSRFLGILSLLHESGRLVTLRKTTDVSEHKRKPTNDAAEWLLQHAANKPRLKLTPLAHEMVQMIYKLIARNSLMTRREFFRYLDATTEEPFALNNSTSSSQKKPGTLEYLFHQSTFAASQWITLHDWMDLHEKAAIWHPKRLFEQFRMLEHKYDLMCEARPPNEYPLTILLADVKVVHHTLLKFLFSAPVKAYAPTAASLREKAELDTDNNSSSAKREEKRKQGIALDALVPVLLQSQHAWMKHPQHQIHLEFLNKFVAAHISGVDRETLLSPTKKKQRTTPMKHSKALETLLDNQRADPVISFSLLFTKCLAEMGGGTAAKQLAQDREDALEAERAFAAACIKHNNLGEVCMKFAGSVDIVRLIMDAQRKGKKIMFSIQCPSWVKALVRATYRDVRTPLLVLLREKSEQKKTVTPKIVIHLQETKMEREGKTEAVSSPVAPEQPVMNGEEAELSLAQAVSGVSNADLDTLSPEANALIMSRVAAIVDNARTDIAESINIHFEDNKMSSTAVEYKTPELTQDELDEAEALDMAISTRIDRVQENALFLLNHSSSSSSQKDQVMLSTTQENRLQAATRALNASLMDDDNVIVRRKSVNSEGDEMKLRTPSSLAPLSLTKSFTSLIGNPTEVKVSAMGSDSDDDSEDSSEDEQMQMMRTLSSRPPTNSTLYRSPVRETTSAAPWLRHTLPDDDETVTFDAQWIAQLIVVGDFDLSKSIQPAVMRVQALAEVRLSFFAQLNATLLQDSHGIVDHVLPSLLRCFLHSPRASLIHYVNAESNAAKSVLLSFYKHIVRILSVELNVVLTKGEIGTMERTKRLLHLFTVDFEWYDAGVIIGSGVYGVLFRFLSGCNDRFLAQPPLDEKHKTVVLCVRNLAWQTYQSLAKYGLANPYVDKAVFARNVGAHCVQLLVTTLPQVAQLDPLLSLDSSVLLPHTLATAKMVLDFSLTLTTQSVVTLLDIQVILDCLERLPPSLQHQCVEILSSEIPKTSPVLGTGQGGGTHLLNQMLTLASHMLLFPWMHILHGSTERKAEHDFKKQKPDDDVTIMQATGYQTWQHPLHTVRNAAAVSGMISLFRTLLLPDSHWRLLLTDLLYSSICRLPVLVADMMEEEDLCTTETWANELSIPVCALAVFGGFDGIVRPGGTVLVNGHLRGVVEKMDGFLGTVTVCLPTEQQKGEYHMECSRASVTAVTEPNPPTLATNNKHVWTALRSLLTVPVVAGPSLTLRRHSSSFVRHLICLKLQVMTVKTMSQQVQGMRHVEVGDSLESVLPLLTELLHLSSTELQSSLTSFVDRDEIDLCIAQRLLAVTCPDIVLSDFSFSSSSSSSSSSKYPSTFRFPCTHPTERMVGEDTMQELKFVSRVVEVKTNKKKVVVKSDNEEELTGVEALESELDDEEENSQSQSQQEEQQREERHSILQQHVETLMEMGIPLELSRLGLARRGGNIQEAVELIFSGQLEDHYEIAQRQSLVPSSSSSSSTTVSSSEQHNVRVWDQLLVNLGLLSPQVRDTLPQNRPGRYAARRRNQAARGVDLRELGARFFRTSSAFERSRLVNRIQAYVETQENDHIQQFDFIDARDVYGDWYLGQVLRVKDLQEDEEEEDEEEEDEEEDDEQKQQLLIHFFGWDDLYNEWIDASSDRIRSASLFEHTIMRLEGDRFIRKVKVYGNVLSAVKEEPHTQNRSKLVSQVHLASAHALADAETLHMTHKNNIELGSAAVISSNCIEHLLKRIGFGSVDLDRDFCIGDRLMVQDTVNKLCEAEVMDLRGDAELRIHYVGWPSKWDEWLPITSPRIQTKNRSVKRAKGRVQDQIDQLVGLVGKTGVVVDMFPTAHRLHDDDPRLREALMMMSKKNNTSYVEVLVPDDVTGSSIVFWTELAFIRQPEIANHTRLVNTGLVYLSPDDLAARAFRNQNQLLQQSLLSVIGTLIQDTVAVPGARLGLDHLFQSFTSFATNVPPLVRLMETPHLVAKHGSLVAPALDFESMLPQKESMSVMSNASSFSRCILDMKKKKTSENQESKEELQRGVGEWLDHSLHDKLNTWTLMVNRFAQYILSSSQEEHKMKEPQLKLEGQLDPVTIAWLHDLSNEMSTKLEAVIADLQRAGELNVTVLTPLMSDVLSLDCQHTDTLVIGFLSNCQPSFSVDFFDGEDATLLLEHVPAVKTGLVVGVPAPFLAPNPCFVRSSSRQTVKVQEDQELDLGDEDFSVLALPASDNRHEAALFFTQAILVLHAQHFVQADYDVAIATQLHTLLVASYDMLSSFYKQFCAICPWPCHIKTSTVETLTHIMHRLLLYKQPVEDLSWLSLVAAEVSCRHEVEAREPVYSVYLQRLVECLVLGTRLEEFCDENKEVKEAAQEEEEEDDIALVIGKHSLRRQLPAFELDWILELSALLYEHVLVCIKDQNIHCSCTHCVGIGKQVKQLHTLLPVLDLHSSLWLTNLQISPRFWPQQARFHLFDTIVDAGAAQDRWMPEFSFLQPPEQQQDSKGMFEQLCSSLRVTPEAHLRGKLGDITWKARFRGFGNKGAEGLPGPFRQSLEGISESLRCGNLFIPCPNFVNETGLNRNKMVLNPSSDFGLDACYRLGQLFGIVIRAQSALDVEISSVFWKTLLRYPVQEEELSEFDYTAWSSLSSFDTTFPVQTFTWSTTLSDGVSRVELRPNGFNKFVTYEERHLYRQAVLKTRLEECALRISHIRAGLCNLISQDSLAMLSAKELELKICGETELDIEFLKSKTIYAPAHFTHDSRIIQDFWKALRNLPSRKQFLQFAWARSRLPPKNATNQTWRMKLNILEGASQQELPTSETCFMNISIPHYNDYETLLQKLMYSVENCSSITS